MATESSIWLSPEDRARLEGLVADRNTPQKVVWRARIVLCAADGDGVKAIMARDGQVEADACGAGRSATRPRASTAC